MKSSLYHFLESNPLTSGYTVRIRKRMEIYRPNGGRENLDRTVDILLAAWAGSGAAFAFLVYFGGLSFAYLCGVICILFAVNMNEVYRRLEKEEIKLLKQFEKFIADVRFHFGFHGIAEESVLEALEDAEREIGLHAEVIYRRLTESREEKDKENAMQNAPNHYFGTFYLLCETVMKYGDRKVDGKSLFLTNLSCLKQEINMEVLRRRKLEHLFSGLIGISLMPVFAIKPLEKWAVGNMGEMSAYYEGRMGIVTTLAICGASLGVCFTIHKLRYETRPLYRESRTLNRILGIRSINSWITGRINWNYARYKKWSEDLKEAGQVENIKEFMLRQALLGAAAFVLTVLLIADIQQTGRHQKAPEMEVPYEAAAAVEETATESFAEDREITFRWYDLLAAAAAGAAAYWWPWFWVQIRKRMLMMEREQEVIRFQAVIIVLMHMDGMSVEVMLSHLEEFAMAFRNTIAKTLDAMDYEGMAALEKMRERESFMPFIRLADAFIACDRLPVHEAFDEIASDRNYYLEKYRQESESLAMDKAAVGRVIGFIPMYITIGCKLVIPFVLEGLNKLSVYAGGIR